MIFSGRNQNTHNIVFCYSFPEQHGSKKRALSRDKARFEELVARRDRVMDYYEAHKSEIEQQYAEAGKILKTEKFWREYLKMPPLEEEAAAEQE